MQEVKTAFTPPPWEPMELINGRLGIVTQEVLVAEVARAGNEQSNANLIAASPVMYEALEAVVKDCSVCSVDVCSYPPHVAVQAALRKARGE